jgi:hypothetical protein
MRCTSVPPLQTSGASGAAAAASAYVRGAQRRGYEWRAGNHHMDPVLRILQTLP